MKIKYGDNESCRNTIQENPQQHIGLWCLQSRKQTTVHELLEGILDQMGQVPHSAARAGGVEGNKPGGGSCLMWWSHTQRIPTALLTITLPRGRGSTRDETAHSSFPWTLNTEAWGSPREITWQGCSGPRTTAQVLQSQHSVFPWLGFPSLVVHPNPPAQLSIVQVPGSPCRPKELELHF